MIEQIIKFLMTNTELLWGLTGGISSLFLLFITYMIKLFLDYVKVKNNPAKFVNNFIYNKGVLVKKLFIDKLKNKQVKEDTIKYLDYLSNVANEAFDASIQGKEKPKLNV